MYTPISPHPPITMHSNAFILIAFLLTHTNAASPTRSVAQRATRTSSCAKTDTHCMNARALVLTNAIRRREGLPDLSMGSEAMLRNAIAHSRIMAGRRHIFHQDIGRIYVGNGACRTPLTGENVAQNFAQPRAHPAALCVEQWRKSPPHYRNIVNKDNVNVIVGVYIDREGKIWCTQTFSRMMAGGECAVAGVGRASKPSMKPAIKRKPKPSVKPDMKSKPKQSMKPKPESTPKPDMKRKSKSKQERTPMTVMTNEQNVQQMTYPDSPDLILVCDKSRCKYCDRATGRHCRWA